MSAKIPCHNIQKLGLGAYQDFEKLGSGIPIMRLKGFSLRSIDDVRAQHDVRELAHFERVALIDDINEYVETMKRIGETVIRELSGGKTIQSIARHTTTGRFSFPRDETWQNHRTGKKSTPLGTDNNGANDEGPIIEADRPNDFGIVYKVEFTTEGSGDIRAVEAPYNPLADKYQPHTSHRHLFVGTTEAGDMHISVAQGSHNPAEGFWTHLKNYFATSASVVDIETTGNTPRSSFTSFYSYLG